jgi:hypothetical protein
MSGIGSGIGKGIDGLWQVLDKKEKKKTVT